MHSADQTGKLERAKARRLKEVGRIRDLLARKELTLAQIDEDYKLPRGTAGNAVHEPHLAGERAIAAVMIESNLLEGSQDYQARPLVRGRSITDACLSWEQTLPVLATMAEAVKRRRG